MKLGQVLSLTRGNQIDIADEKQYVIAGVQNSGKGVLNKRRVTGAELKMKKYQVIEENQLMWCKVDTKNGAFGVTTKDHVGSLASTNMALAAIDTKKIKPEFISALFQIQGFHEHITKYSSGTTNRQYLTPTQLFELIEIPNWSITKQEEFLVRLDLIQNSPFFAKIDQQLTHLTQLRQALLREAMQGQLLPQDPTDEPAAVLLQQLQAAAKPGKKGRGGTLFTEKAKTAEGPFAIPTSWAWCTLGDLVVSSDAGTSFQCTNRPITGDEWGVIKLSAISWDKFLPEQNKFYSAEAPEELAAQIRTGDFIISRANTTELVGKSVVVQEGNYNLLLSDKSIRFTFSPLISVAYANLCNNSQFARAHYANAANGSSPSMKNITQANMRNLPIPLPPLAEQHRIVAKLAQLLQHCDALEQRIRASRQLAEQLLATALREALAPPTGTELAEEVEAELVEVEVAPAAPRRGRPLKQRLATNDPDLFSELADSFGVE